MTVSTIPSIFYEFAFNTDPNTTALAPYWSNLSSRVQYGWTVEGGRQYELDVNEAGLWRVELANPDGALDPGNAASPYAPILPYRPCRIRVVLGNNLLLPDQASAGEWSPWAAGPLPAASGVSPGVGNVMVIGAVGAQAYQGTQVFVSTVPSGAAAPSDLIRVTVPQITAGTTYTFSIQAQAVTSGQNPSVQAAIDWIGTNGSTLSTTTGSAVGLTGASGTWSSATVTGTAPTGAVVATVRLFTTTSPTANSTVWTDGLQLEARGYATRWQMPWTPGTNLLPQNIATGTETMAATDSVTNWFYPNTGTVAQATNLTAAPSGQTTALAWSAPAGSVSLYALYLGSNLGQTIGPVSDCVQVTPGQSYTTSMYLTRSGPDATVAMAVTMQFFNSAGLSVGTAGGGSTTVPTSGWVRAAASGTAPAGAAWVRPFLSFTTVTLTGTEVIKVTGLQVEQAAAASTWADPGPATFLFTGLVERFPRTWIDLSGTYGTSRLQCVDATAAMSQNPLLAPFIQEVMALGPNFLYQLNEPAGATSCIDTTGKRVAAPVENSPYGAGTVTFGSAVTSTNQGLAFVGASGPVATFVNNSAGYGQQVQEAETFVSIHKTTATPGPPTAGPWTRIIHFRSPTAPASSSNAFELWSALPPTIYTGNVSAVQFAIIFASAGVGVANLQVLDKAGDQTVYTGVANLCDGNWHQFAITFDSSRNAAFYVDGQAVTPSINSNPLAQAQIGFTSDVLGASIQIGAGYYRSGHNGDLSCAIELPFAATAAQMTNLYNSWRSASSGDSSGARYARILKWIGYPGATSIASGSTQSMGPATDATGQTPITALNLVAATENGNSFVSAAGVVTFTARSALYGVRTPVAVFGEALPAGNAGEWPAEVGSIDFDPSHLANTVQVTQYQGAVYTGSDATSARRYFPRTYQRTVNVTSGSEAQDAANYLVSQLKDPHQRATAIRLHPSAVPGLFPVVAQIDKTARIRYIKRPTGAPSTTIDAFVQRIAWTWTAGGDVFVEYQASPADLVNYWRIGALHTTLSAQANSGQNQATINALPDAARNKLAQSMPTSQTLWFEPGTSRFEAVTVQTVPSTALNYTTATLTMAANLAFTHPAGSVVCEPLQTGVTDATTWDASSVLGASYAQIQGGGGAGTNTVTVGPLPDAAYNALGQTWNTGDQVVLSSGGAGTAETATIASVSTTFPGYTSATITFTANLANNHPAGDYVSDVFLTAGTNPATLAPTTRVTY